MNKIFTILGSLILMYYAGFVGGLLIIAAIILLMIIGVGIKIAAESIFLFFRPASKYVTGKTDSATDTAVFETFNQR